MTSNSEQVHAEKVLRNFSGTIETIKEYVGNKYFPSFSIQKWELPETTFNSKITKALHRLFSFSKRLQEFYMFFPTNIIVLISLVISFTFHWLFPFFFYIIRLIVSGQFHLSFARTAILLLVLLSPLASILSATGVYWTVYEIAINKAISPRVKIILALFIAFYIYFFIFDRKIYQTMSLSSRMEWGDIGLEKFLITITNNPSVLLLAFILVYIPFTLFFAIFISKALILGISFVGCLLQWYFWAQITQPHARLNEFLTTPLVFFDKESPKTFLEIESFQINAINNWINVRRQIIQNRLIPASLVFTFLGILASTSVGENALKLISKIITEFFSATTNLGITGGYEAWMISSGKYALLIIIIAIFVGPLSLLFHESVLLDFISEACAVAKSVKIIEDANESSSIPSKKSKSNWLVNVLSWLFRKF
jgi:hypothetical protein